LLNASSSHFDPTATWAGLKCRSAAVIRRIEVCYPFCRKHGRHQAVNRREFITLLGGAAAAWPLTARAQQSERVRRVGVLTGIVEADAEGQARFSAFRNAMDQAGWIEGRNIQYEYRSRSGGNTERASSRGRNPPICRCRHQPSTSW
jgi:hypothetical protein